jgi:nucleoside-diphosphate-sugar epimerase
VVAADLAKAEAVKGLGSGFDVVVHCASSGRGGVDAYREVYFEGMRNLLTFAPARFLFTSSTSVYAQTDGMVVSEESKAEPTRETGQILRGTEQLVLARNGIVARLAGIYGPGRSVMLKKFFYGEATIEGDGTRWINQVHRDDIAAALFHLIRTGEPGIFNVADDRPIQQRALYQWLATRYERPLPPSGPADPDRKRGLTNKRVSNAKLRSTGWQPRFPSFFKAVETDPRLMQAL